MKAVIVLFLSLLIVDAHAQVQQNVVVEHFTNTRCSICGRKNPALFTNLNNHPTVLHMSVHPSSPYSTCLLNRHNVSENDARTRYYGVYGATPRIAVQGMALGTSVDFSSPSILTGAIGKMSPLRIDIVQQRKGMDSLRIDITVIGAGMHNLDSLQLFSAILEDTVFYNAPNGENTHRNVFRKALFGAEGQRFYPPANGDSISFSACVAYHVDWDKSRVYPIVIVQESSNKQVVQAETDNPLGPMSTLVPGEGKSFKVYPNPTSRNAFLELAQEKETKVYMYDAIGKLQRTFQMQGSSRLDLQNLSPGSYFLELEGDEQRVKLIIY